MHARIPIPQTPRTPKGPQILSPFVLPTGTERGQEFPNLPKTPFFLSIVFLNVESHIPSNDTSKVPLLFFFIPIILLRPFVLFRLLVATSCFNTTILVLMIYCFFFPLWFCRFGRVCSRCNGPSNHGNPRRCWRSHLRARSVVPSVPRYARAELHSARRTLRSLLFEQRE